MAAPPPASKSVAYVYMVGKRLLSKVARSSQRLFVHKTKLRQAVWTKRARSDARGAAGVKCVADFLFFLAGGCLRAPINLDNVDRAFAMRIIISRWRGSATSAARRAYHTTGARRITLHFFMLTPRQFTFPLSYFMNFLFHSRATKS
jgi:hypothetical protein